MESTRVAASSRPLPTPTPLTEEFWEAARRRTLVRPVCRQCASSFFTPQIACPYCLSLEWDYVASSGRGVVYSFTVVHRPPTAGFDPPYVLAIIDLVEGWSMLSNIVGCTPDDVSIDMLVEADFEEVSAGILLPVFVPAQVSRR